MFLALSVSRMVRIEKSLLDFDCLVYVEKIWQALVRCKQCQDGRDPGYAVGLELSVRLAALPLDAGRVWSRI